VAPAYQQSGKACSISTFLGITLKKIDNNHLSVDGTPVDCVEVACAMLNKKIDLVVSGCNSGYNLSQDVMYSGTCGACFQASLSKIPSIAFSVKGKDYFEQVDKYADEVNKYTVKKICQTTSMDIFEAFRCMVLLIEEPDEALKLLKKDAK
jgi:5'-nucleotidase